MSLTRNIQDCCINILLLDSHWFGLVHYDPRILALLSLLLLSSFLSLLLLLLLLLKVCYSYFIERILLKLIAKFIFYKNKNFREVSFSICLKMHALLQARKVVDKKKLKMKEEILRQFSVRLKLSVIFKL